MNMKRWLAAGLTTTMMAALLAGCGGETKQPAGSQGASAEGKDKLNVAVILKTTASEYWGYVQAGALAYGQEHPEVSVNVSGAPSETSYDEQLSMIETAIGSNSYDAFVIAPLQADLVTNRIQGIQVPVIAVDTRIDAPEVLSFVGTGNKAASELGGKEAVKLAKERGWTELKAISISGVQGDATATDRLEGYKAGVTAAGGEFLEGETQYADAVADKAVTAMEAIIQKYPQGIAMILCNNDDMAIAAARAAKDNAAYKNTVFVGFDGIVSACDAILAGQETLSVAQDAYGMGYKAVEAAVKAIRKEQIEKFIDSGASVVTPENAQARKDQLNKYLGK